MSCPYRRRGHTWREATGADDLAIEAMSLRTHPHELRLCSRCGALGRVDGQGTIKTVSEPRACCTVVVTGTDVSFTCGLERGHKSPCAPPINPSRPLGWGVTPRRLKIEHPCDRDDVRAAVLKLAELAVELDFGPSFERYLERRNNLVQELMSLLA